MASRVRSAKDSKVPNMFFGSKIPKFHFGFGSARHQKKDKEPSPKKIPEPKTKLLSPGPQKPEPAAEGVEKKHLTPNLSIQSSKFSSNSPEIAKLRKNLMNAREKRRVESFSVTTSKIPILRAKICDNASTKNVAKNVVVVSVNVNADTHQVNVDSDFSAKVNKDAAKENFLPQTQRNQFFETRTKSTMAENFFRPILQPPDNDRDSNLGPKAAPKPNASMNTKDFLSAFLAEKGTSRPVVERGLVRERAKAFEQKIQEIRTDSTPRPSDVRKLVVPRPTSLASTSTKSFVPSSLSKQSAWSTLYGSTPTPSTTISSSFSAQKNDGKTGGSQFRSFTSGSKTLPGSQAKPDSSSYSHSPLTPASSFVPHSASSGSSGAWSSWSASTPPSSTSISAAAAASAGIRTLDRSSGGSKKNSSVWQPVAKKPKPEEASGESDQDTVPEIPQRFQHTMTR